MARQSTAKDSGYALVAALAAVLAFSLLAFEVLASTRGSVASAGGELDHARLSAAVDAGVAAAIAGLATDDVTLRWPIDGRRQNLTFDGMALAITVEDERGKIPLNNLSEDQVRSVFEIAGASGERLDTLVDSFEDWIDDDDDARPSGAELAGYAPRGYRPRNGALRTVDELLLIKGMDQALYDRIAPALTVNFGESGAFSPKTAQPFAIAVMTGTGMGSAAVIERQRELAGERPAVDITDDGPLAGRLLTVRVLASDGSGGQMQRAVIIELTGNAANPYWIRRIVN